ncbi:MAG: hypothetical protein C4321_09125 [Chloroflexota bacterium]
MITRLDHEGFPVAAVCQALGVSLAGYYAHVRGEVGPREQDDARLRPLVRQIFWEHKRRYGARRIAVELAARGEACGPGRVARLLKQLGLQAIQPKSFRPRTTQSRHPLGYSPNFLLETPRPDAINQVWLGDITFIPLAGSALVDADFLDTEAHHTLVPRESFSFQPDELLERIIAEKEAKPRDGELNELRNRIFQQCLKAAEHEPGGQRLRQCLYGIVFRHDQDRTGNGGVREPERRL